MYTDNTLTPKEAVRLCALGTLAGGPMTYAALAESIRHFMSLVIGPSLDVMGQSIELLRYEGLVDAFDDGTAVDSTLTITEAGQQALNELLKAPVRMGATELNKLIVALKFRFLHLLDAPSQAAQIEILREFADNELMRLTTLRASCSSDNGNLIPWLDHDISLLEQRVSWLEAFTPQENTTQN